MWDVGGSFGAVELAASSLLAAAAGLALARSRRQARRLARLSDYRLLLAHVHRLIADADDEDAFLHDVCALTVEHAGVALTWIGRPEADGVFRYLAAAGAQRAYLDGLEISVDAQRPQGQGTSGRAWRDGRAYFNTTFGRTAFLAPWAARAARFGLRTSAAIPIRLHGRVWAVFTLYSTELHPFDPPLTALIHDLAHAISAGLSRIGLVRDERAAQNLNAVLLDNTVVGIDLVQYPERRVIEANAALVHMLGYESREQLLGVHASQLYVDPDMARRMARLAARVLREGSAELGDVRVRRRDGSMARLDLHGKRLGGDDAGHPVIVWTSVDATRKYELEAGLKRQALYDELTDLPNRRALRERLLSSIERARERGAALAVGVLDLDDFKPVNDRHGHDVGDQLLRDIVQRLQGALRPGDMLARIGGDEFVLLLDELPRQPAPQLLEARLAPLHQALRPALPIRGHEPVRIGMTMGLALYPDDATEADALLREADAAMYQAKTRKATRTSWWRRADEPPPTEPDDAEVDAFSEAAAQWLRNIQEAFDEVTQRYAAEFDRLALDKPAAQGILDCLSLVDRGRLKRTLATHLLQILSPQARADACEQRARRVGQVHALVGLSPGTVSATLNEYRSMMRDRVQALNLSPRERTRLMQVINARMQFELQHELTRMQEVHDAFNEHLARALPDPTTTWTSIVRAELDALCELPGLRAVFVMRLSPDGRFFAEFSAGDGTPMLDGVLQDADLQPSLDSRKPCGQGLVAQAWRSDEIQRSDAALLDARLQSWSAALRGAGVQSAVTLPVKDARNSFVLALYGAYPHQFSSGWARTFTASLRTRWEHVARASRNAFTPLLWQEAAEYRRLLHSGGLEMHGQPVLDTATARLHKVEMLARLRGADGRVVAPARFLPALDDADIHALFRLGLDQALQAQAAWRSQGLALEVSLNVAPATLLHDETEHWVDQALRRHGSAPQSLTLEILESQEFLDERQAQAVHRLAALGVRLAIDDLGAGYSSLKRLVNLPFDVIKIDQALLRELAADPAKVLGLVNAIIRIGEDLGRTVVVEGVEDAAALEAMMILGAREVQGYAVARPLPLRDVAAWVRGFACPRGGDGVLHSLLGAFTWHWVHLRREPAGSAAALAPRLDPLRDYLRRHHAHDTALLDAVQRYADAPTPRDDAARELLELLLQRLRGTSTQPRAA